MSQPLPRPLAGRVALVTGASRGIGAAIAQRFAAEGAKVALLARTRNASSPGAESLQTTVDAIARDGGQALALQVDLTSADERARAIAHSREALGPIDILVNNAALADGATIEELRQTYEVNVLAPLDLAQQLVPGMRERGAGWILNIGSVGSQLPDPPFDDFHREATDAWLHYAASKAALDRLTRGLAAVHESSNIAVHLLAPTGLVITSRLVEAWGRERTAALEARGEGVERVEAMAEAALALCGEPASQQTGLHVACGALLEERGITVRSLTGAPLES